MYPCWFMGCRIDNSVFAPLWSYNLLYLYFSPIITPTLVSKGHFAQITNNMYFSFKESKSRFLVVRASILYSKGIMKMAQTVKLNSQPLIVRLTPDSQQIFYRNDNPILITFIELPWVTAFGPISATSLCRLYWQPLFYVEKFMSPLVLVKSFTLENKSDKGKMKTISSYNPYYGTIAAKNMGQIALQQAQKI